MRINLAVLKSQIDALLAEYPELCEDEQLRLNTIEGETELFELLQITLDDILKAKAMQAAIAGRIEDLRARKERFALREEAFRKMAHRLMNVGELRKVQLTEATLSIRASPAGVRIIDQGFIPEEYWRVKREPDLMEIKRALKDGTEVPGAALSNNPDTIAILTK